MATAATDTIEHRLSRMLPVTTSPEQQDEFINLLRHLTDLHDDVSDNLPTIQLTAPNGLTIELPQPIFSVLERAVELLAQGEGISIVPVSRELTTQEAADLLNISRQYLVRLLDNDEIPYTKVGTHRRVKAAHVLAYKRERDLKRREGLRKLSRLTEEFGGYDAELK